MTFFLRTATACGAFVALILCGCSTQSAQTVQKAEINSKDRVQQLNTLAQSARASGKISEAEAYYNQALEQAEKDYGKDAPQEVAILNQLADIYRQSKQFEKCQDAAARSLKICDKRFGPDSPFTEMAMSNYISVACLNGVCKDETGLMERLLQIRVKRFGPDAGQTITARQMAAEARLHHKDYLAAASLYKENAEAYERKHSNLALAAWLQHAGALHRADRNAEAYTILKGVTAKAPPDQGSIAIFAMYGDVCAELGKNAEADKAYSTMASTAEKTSGKDSTMTADYLVRYAEFLKHTGKTKQAAALDKRIEAIYKK